MSWEKDPLWAKSKLFLERAFSESREDSLFCLWCSLGLELLARAALASVSPTLLAEPDPEQRFLLHALRKSTQAGSPRSIGTSQVFKLCSQLFEKFSKEDLTASLALANRRNDELHTGMSAFDEYPAKVWLPSFYRACRSLAESMGESLVSLFGEEEAKIAGQILQEIQEEVQGKTQSTIAAHKKVFEAKSEQDRAIAAKNSSLEAERLAHERHHRVACPACKSDAVVQGETFGEEQVSIEDDVVVLRQPVSPRAFHCSACGLSLQGYAALNAAGLGGLYTRRTEYSPEDFYGLIDPKTADLSPYLDEYLADIAGARAWDNE